MQSPFVKYAIQISPSCYNCWICMLHSGWITEIGGIAMHHTHVSVSSVWIGCLTSAFLGSFWSSKFATLVQFSFADLETPVHHIWNSSKRMSLIFSNYHEFFWRTYKNLCCMSVLCLLCDIEHFFGVECRVYLTCSLVSCEFSSLSRKTNHRFSFSSAVYFQTCSFRIRVWKKKQNCSSRSSQSDPDLGRPISAAANPMQSPVVCCLEAIIIPNVRFANTKNEVTCTSNYFAEIHFVCHTRRFCRWLVFPKVRRRLTPEDNTMIRWSHLFCVNKIHFRKEECPNRVNTTRASTRTNNIRSFRSVLTDCKIILKRFFYTIYTNFRESRSRTSVEV